MLDYLKDLENNLYKAAIDLQDKRSISALRTLKFLIQSLREKIKEVEECQ